MESKNKATDYTPPELEGVDGDDEIQETPETQKIQPLDKVKGKKINGYRGGVKDLLQLGKRWGGAALLSVAIGAGVGHSVDSDYREAVGLDSDEDRNGSEVVQQSPDEQVAEEEQGLLGGLWDGAKDKMGDAKDWTIEKIEQVAPEQVKELMNFKKNVLEFGSYAAFWGTFMLTSMLSFTTILAGLRIRRKMKINIHPTADRLLQEGTSQENEGRETINQMISRMEAMQATMEKQAEIIYLNMKMRNALDSEGATRLNMDEQKRLEQLMAEVLPMAQEGAKLLETTQE